MNENVVQIGVALVIVNLVAWGGFTMLQDEDTNEVIKYITVFHNGITANITHNTTGRCPEDRSAVYRYVRVLYTEVYDSNKKYLKNG